MQHGSGSICFAYAEDAALMGKARIRRAGLAGES